MSPREYLARPKDIFDGHNWKSAFDIQWVEAGNAGNNLKYTEEHLTTNNHLIQYVNTAKVENTWPIKSSVFWSLPINQQNVY